MKRRGFTLVELMIVVAIIGILAAIAIPNFVAMQYRAKRAEVPANVDAIKTAEMGYDAAFDGFIAVTAHPTTAPGKTPRSWGNSNAGFQALGWVPDGEVRGQYSVTTVAPSGANPGGDFAVTGICDVDGDNASAEYTSSKSVNAVQNTPNDVF